MASAPLSAATIERLHAAIRDTLARTSSAGDTVFGERREVVVLAVQVRLRGAGEADAGDDDVWLDEALRIILSVVHRYAGTIDSFTTDGVLALFGGSTAHEDDAIRAARAALAIQAALEPLEARLRQQHERDFACAIGLHSGPVLHGQTGFGELDYTVIGDTVQRAVHLRDAASAGAIVVSADIAERTRGGFAYQPYEPAARHQADHAYALLGTSSPELGGGPLPTPGALIGRVRELARLSDALQDVLRHGSRRVAVVSGDGGIGKSRLVAEFCAAAAREQHVRCYTARCSTATRSMPLSLVVGVVQRLLGLGSDAPGAVQRHEMERALERLALPVDNLLPYLAHAFGESPASRAGDDQLRALDPVMLQRQTHLALRQVCLAAASGAPCVIVLEDLQWIDPASRDFLEYLVQTTHGGDATPFLLVLVTRDTGLNATASPLLAAAAQDPAGVVGIELQPLSAEEGQALIELLLGRPAPALHDLAWRLVTRAAGNPLFIEELVRMLVEQQAVVDDRGVWALAAAPERVLQQVPDTLQGLLLARFVALPERLRRLVQRAAVLGRSFPQRFLAQLEGGSTQQLAAELQLLVARQFLTPDGAAPAATYVFQNALLQETVYGTLLVADRQRLHGLAARMVEADALLADDERTQLLAYHYAECATPHRALPFLVSAAEHSARRYANETAIQHFRRALALAAEHDALARIRIGLARALKFTGQYAEATQLLHETVESLRARGDGAPLLAEVLCELAEVHQRDGELELAVRALDEGLDLLGDPALREHRRLRSRLIDRLASVRFRQGDLDAAHALAVCATRDARLDVVDDPVTMASLFNTLGGVLWQRGDLSQASWNVEQSLRVYQHVGYSWGMATAYTNLGILSYTRGVWPEAVEHFQRSDSLRKEIGYIPERAVNLKNLGVLQMEMGDHAQARQSLETSLAISRRIGDDYGAVVATLQLADLALLQQRLADARAWLGQAVPLLPAAGEDEEILFRWLSGLADAAEGQVARGIASIRAALEQAVAAGVPELEIDCERALGALQSRIGDAEAELHLQRSLGLSGTHSSTYRKGLALYELGWHYYRCAKQGAADRSDHLARARRSWEQALELFGSLGAHHELGRVRSALAASVQ